MSETPPRDRARPGPGLATIAEPERRVALWALNRRAINTARCAQCGAVAGRHHRPAVARDKDAPRLCRPCVEGVAGG